MEENHPEKDVYKRQGYSLPLGGIALSEEKRTAAPEVSYGDQVRIRREKLSQLQETGHDPFQLKRFVVDSDSAAIKKDFDALEGKPVSVAGKMCIRDRLTTS